MDYLAQEWFHLAVRWVHVIAGVMWIGQTYLFNWFERHLPDERDANADENIAGNLWMVHGGGFYLLEKQKVPQLMPRTLHWFRFESLVTWVSGATLLVLVYYLGGALTDASVSSLSLGQAIALSLGLLVGAWLVYDLLMAHTPLYKSDLAAGLVFFPMIVCVCWLCAHTLSGRAAYIQLGAMFGTIMVSNVWMRILPGQRRMIEARKAGQTPDMTFGARGKQRSKHNTYMSMPVIAVMISNHFPVATYGSEYNWLILAGLVLVGFVAAHFIRNH